MDFEEKGLMDEVYHDTLASVCERVKYQASHYLSESEKLSPSASLEEYAEFRLRIQQLAESAIEDIEHWMKTFLWK